MQTSDYIAIISLTISLILFVHSHYTNTKKYELVSNYRKDIIDWHAATVEVLIRLKLEMEADTLKGDLKRELLAKLSACIEVGRFYFPNVKNGYGLNKQPAYQGYRSIVLDFPVFSYRLFSGENAKEHLKHAEIFQKYFTSYVFEILDPYDFLKQTKRHTDKDLRKELDYEDVMRKDPNILIGYINDYTKRKKN